MEAKNTAPAARRPVLIALSDYENALESFPSENDPKTDRSVPAARRQPASEFGLDFFRSENSPVDVATPVKAGSSARGFGAGWLAWIGAACGAILLSFWAGQLVIPSLMRPLDTAKDPQTQVARAPTLPPPATHPPVIQTPVIRTPATRQPPTPKPAPRSVPASPLRQAPTTPVTPPRMGAAPNPATAASASPPPATAAPVPAVSPAPLTSGGASSTELRAPAPTVGNAPDSVPVTPPRASAPAAAAPLPTPPSDARAASSPPPAPAPVVTDEMAVSATLERYRAAYSQLNAEGAKAVWPSVDVKTLAKAFDQLESQDIVFTGCHVLVTGDRANAVCNGNAAFVPKVGTSTPRIAYREWNFDLRRAGARWVISAVDVR